MNLFLLLTICSLFISLSFSSSIVHLTDNDFQSTINENNSNDIAVLVEFYAPWCKYCKKMEPTWEKLATDLDALVVISKIDCTIHKTTCLKYHIQGYPTIKLFIKDKVKPFSGYRNYSGFLEYLDIHGALKVKNKPKSTDPEEDRKKIEYESLSKDEIIERLIIAEKKVKYYEKLFNDE